METGNKTPEANGSLKNPSPDRLSKSVFLAGFLTGPALFGFHASIKYANAEPPDILVILTFLVLLAGGVGCVASPFFGTASATKKLFSSALAFVIVGLFWTFTYMVLEAFFGSPLIGPTIQ